MNITRLFTTNPKVFLNILIEDTHAGTLTFELFSKILPKTCENFIQICQGISPTLTDKGKKLVYEGSKIHRVVPGFLCQGGDLTNHNGKGGWSIYGQYFDCENFTLKHDKAGLLSMANHGPNTVNSQFFITFAACPSLNNKHTVFGSLSEDFSLLKKIESLGTASGKPRLKIKLGECGVI